MGVWIGYDLWLYIKGWVEVMIVVLVVKGGEFVLVMCNLVDIVWVDRFVMLFVKVKLYDVEFVGCSVVDKWIEIVDWLM